MRWWYGLALLAGCATIALQAQPPGVPPVRIVNADYHVRLAAWHQATQVSEEDQPYVRYISLYRFPARLLGLARRIFPWWLNQLSFNPAVARWREVSDGKALLYAVDMRDMNWSFSAFRAVAQRDRIFREPWVSSKDAGYLRLSIGAKQDDKNFTTGVIIDGAQFLRDTLETDRSPSYYDLLYARQRFGVRYYWPGDREYPRGWYYDLDKGVDVEGKNHPPGFVDADFPRNKKDWEKAFGIVDVETFLKKQDIRIQKGAVVAGSLNDPNGSFVARSDRLVEILSTPFGVSLETYDVFETSGLRDYIEQAPDLAQGRIVFDAQELLASLPNGGQAALLTNAEGKRLEVADNKAATDRDPTDRRVRTPGSCVTCHAASNGLIPPRDLVKRALDLGGDFKIKDRTQANDFTAFFLRWERRIKGWQEPYAILLDATTEQALAPQLPLEPGGFDRRVYLTPANAPKTMTGAQVGEAIFELRAWYDRPVDLAQAAHEVGVPVEVLEGILIQVPGLKNGKGSEDLPGAKNAGVRAGLLLRGTPCPRPAWDKDLLPRVLAVLAADRLQAVPAQPAVVEEVSK